MHTKCNEGCVNKHRMLMATGVAPRRAIRLGLGRRWRGGRGAYSRAGGRVILKVPTSIGTCSITAMAVCIFDYFPMEGEVGT